MPMTPLKTVATLSAPTLALSLLVGFSGSSVDKIAFTPAEGATVTKTFSSLTELEVDDMSMLVNGEEPPIPPMTMTMSVTQTLTVTDEYVAMGDGQPSKLARTYDAVSSGLEVEFESVMGSGTPSGVGSSPLEGSTVHFTWDSDTESYEAAFAEGEEGEDELLEGLEEDLDLRTLLPEEELAEGDTYEIEVGAFADVIAAGGDLHLEIDVDGDMAGAGMDPEMMTDFRRFFDEMLEGDATGKYVGARDMDGIKVAVIEIEVELNATADMSALAAESMGEGLPDGASMQVNKLDVEMSYEGTGELHWNLAKGVIHGFSIEAQMTMDTDMEVDAVMGGQETTIASEIAVSGTVTNTVTTK